MSILDELIEAARRRARDLPRDAPLVGRPAKAFDEALRGKERLKVVAEFKRASPSLGPIAEANVARQVRSYVEAGASAVSVLTEPTHFHGSYEDLEAAVRAVDVPVLMKDFVVHPAQVRLAARLGAGAVLLIKKGLSASELDELVSACRGCGLSPLVECHDEREIEATLEMADAIIGINNRDLDTFEIDRGRAERLLPAVPKDRIAVAESGYEDAAQARALRGLADAVLMGTALMKAERPAELIREVTR